MTALWLLTSSTLVLAGGLAPGEEYAPDGGNFSIRFPGKPKESTPTAKTKNGELEVEVHIATFANSDGNAYMVSYSDLPDASRQEGEPGFALPRRRRGRKGTDGGRVNPKLLEFGPDKLPGRILEFDRASNQHVKMWVILAGNRLFQVAVVGSSKFCESKDATTFLESFKVMK